MNMKTKRFQRTAAMLLCIFICAWTMFPLMGAAFAAEGLHDTAEAEITCCCDIRCTADTPQCGLPRLCAGGSRLHWQRAGTAHGTGTRLHL